MLTIFVQQNDFKFDKNDEICKYIWKLPKDISRNGVRFLWKGREYFLTRELPSLTTNTQCWIKEDNVDHLIEERIRQNGSK